jgi:hypothetical protein
MSFTVIKPRSRPPSSTTGSFSIRCLPRIRSASSSVVPTGAVISPCFVIASATGRSRLRSNWRSRLVRIPTSRPSVSTIGTPDTRNRAMRFVASRSDAVSGRVYGLLITPLSERFTMSTCIACRSIDMFLCSTPMPPARAIATAISASVTVSIAAETNGMFSSMRRVNQDLIETSFGCVRECRGESRTSSKVSATSARTRAAPFTGSERDGPRSAGGCAAGRVSDRIVVAMAKRRRLDQRSPERRSG